MPKSFKHQVAVEHGGEPHSHSHGWDTALEEALAQASKNLGTGEYDIEVEFWAHVKVTNPGQIFAYGVKLTRPDA
jgi:hypothetical protein